MVLSADELLSKCLHGQTQNANEALNVIIWNSCPKQVFVSRTTLASADLHYNNGLKGLHSVLQKLCLRVGRFNKFGAQVGDQLRVKKLETKSGLQGGKKKKKAKSY